MYKINTKTIHIYKMSVLSVNSNGCINICICTCTSHQYWIVQIQKMGNSSQMIIHFIQVTCHSLLWPFIESYNHKTSYCNRPNFFFIKLLIKMTKSHCKTLCQIKKFYHQDAVISLMWAMVGSLPPMAESAPFWVSSFLYLWTLDTKTLHA